MTKQTETPKVIIRKPLTDEQFMALRAIKGGADIYDYGLAGILRELEKTHRTLFEITKPMVIDTGTGKDKVPYFGAILTSEGKRRLKAEL